MDRKPSFRQFCQDMSDQFLHLPTEHRLRDATGSSVRLAMTFLRPWFHSVVVDDFTEATETVCSLAFIIAQWPAQWWSRDHVEMWDVIRSLVQSVGEEVREKQKGVAVEEVRRLQGVVSNLERVVQDYEEAEVASSVDSTNDMIEAEVEESAVMPPSPPASITEWSVDEDTLIVALPTATAPPAASFSQATLVDVATPGPDSNRPKTPTLIFAPMIVVHQSATEQTRPIPELESPHGESQRHPKRRPHSLAETATCIVTGLLVGAFITLCIVNSQRRTLIYVT
jgi:hypothetical protein